MKRLRAPFNCALVIGCLLASVGYQVAWGYLVVKAERARLQRELEDQLSIGAEQATPASLQLQPMPLARYRQGTARGAP